MKRTLSIILAVITALSVFAAAPLTASADADIPGLTIIEYSDHAEINKYTGSAESLTLPATYNGKPVTVIYNSAFSNNKILKSVVIPSGYETIKADAFYNCDKLESVTIPDSVTSILERAFCDCDELNNVRIPNTIDRILPNTFSFCWALNTIYIPKSVTEVMEYAFNYVELSDIYYAGSQFSWNKIVISDKENGNIAAAPVHFAEENPANTKTLSSVAVTGVIAPKGGEYPSFDNITVGAGAAVEKVSWYEGNNDYPMSGAYPFANGNNYRVEITLVPAANAIFAVNGSSSAVSATVNGNPAECSGTAGRIIVRKTFTAGVVEKTVLSTVTVTGVTEPVAGAHPVEAATVSGGTVLDDFGWYDKTKGDWITTSDTFINGNIYQAKAYIKAANGYKFKTADDKPDVAVTINGRIAKVSKVAGWAADEGFVATVTYGEYTVSFNANGGSGSMPDDGEQLGGYVLPDCDFTAPSGKHFKAWAAGSANGTQYDAGYEYDVTEDVVFYAVWEADEPAPQPEPEHVHEWGAWEVQTPATGDEDGVMIRECLENPAHTETKLIARVSDIYSSDFKYDYTGKPIKPAVTVKDSNGKKLVKGTDYKVVYPTDPVKTGAYSAEIRLMGKYSGIQYLLYSISMVKNPMTIKVTAKSVKAATVKKKNVTVKAITVSKAQGTVSYKKMSGNAKIKVNSKTGKLTVKKGLKKGIYKVNVKVTAKGNGNYKSANVTKTVTIKVK